MNPPSDDSPDAEAEIARPNKTNLGGSSQAPKPENEPSPGPFKNAPELEDCSSDGDQVVVVAGDELDEKDAAGGASL